MRPSPKKQTVTCPLLRNCRAERAAGRHRDSRSYDAIVPPMNPQPGAYMCMLPPRPAEHPVALPHNSAITCLPGTPLASAWP